MNILKHLSIFLIFALDFIYLTIKGVNMKYGLLCVLAVVVPVSVTAVLCQMGIDPGAFGAFVIGFLGSAGIMALGSKYAVA